MPKKVAGLTDMVVRRARVPEGKRTLEMRDGNGLLLRVTPSGTKSWYFVYDHPQTGKRQRMKLGEYPAMSLSAAREAAMAQRALVQQGIDPSEHRKAEQARLEAQRRAYEAEHNPTFWALFERYYREKERDWSPGHARDIWQRMEKHVRPYIGDVPVRELTLQQILAVLKRMEAQGIIDTMKRIRQYINGVMRYGVTFGLCPHNPLNDLDHSVFRKGEHRHYAFTTDQAVLRQVLRAIDEYVGDAATKAALQLQPHVFLRASELAGMRWEEVDFEARLIEIPAERMKKKRTHLIPMSQWVYEHLMAQYAIWGEASPFVFPSPRSLQRHINPQSLGAALNRMGFKGIQSFHGFRHTASTLLNEMGFNSDWVELQLAHVDRNRIRGTYNKAQYLAGRKRMLEQWSQWLVSLKEASKVVPLFQQQA